MTDFALDKIDANHVNVLGQIVQVIAGIARSERARSGEEEVGDGRLHVRGGEADRSAFRLANAGAF